MWQKTDTSVASPLAQHGVPRKAEDIAILHRLLRARPVAEATGMGCEGRLRGLDSLRRQASPIKSRGLQSPGCTTGIGLL